MPLFRVSVTRTQTQSIGFTVEASSQKDLEKKLISIENDCGFSELDHHFDDGEVDSIDYEVGNITTCKKGYTSFADEDLQGMLDNA